MNYDIFYEKAYASHALFLMFILSLVHIAYVKLFSKQGGKQDESERNEGIIGNF